MDEMDEVMSTHWFYGSGGGGGGGAGVRVKTWVIGIVRGIILGLG